VNLKWGVLNNIEKICHRVYRVNETGQEATGKMIANLKMYMVNRAMRKKLLIHLIMSADINGYYLIFFSDKED
jgi:hypothetical protein